MSLTKYQGLYGHYPPVIPDSSLEGSGIIVEYNANRSLSISTEHALIDTTSPGDGIVFTVNPDNSYDISVSVTYFDNNYLRNDGDTGVGDYEFTGALTNNGHQVWHPGNDGSGSGLDADKLRAFIPSSSDIADTIVLRDTNADIIARLFRSTYTSVTAAPAATADICYRNNDNPDNYLRFVGREGMLSYLHAGETNVHVGRGVAQSIPNAVQTRFYFNTELADRLGEWDTGTSIFRPEQNGVYLFSSLIWMTQAAWGANKKLQLSLYKNNVFFKAGHNTVTFSAVTNYISAHLTISIDLTTTDYAEIRVYQTNGVSMNTHNSTAHCWLTVARVG